MLLAAALAAATVPPAPAAPPECRTTLCQPEALAPFFRKLAVQGRARGTLPLHILQIGDSHTAGDAISGALRTALQARYGAGGRGALPPGRPYKGYITNGVTVTMSPDWTVRASFGPGSAEPRPPIGLSGFSLTSGADGATMALNAEAGMAFDRLTLCGMTAPGAGRVSVALGFTTVEIDMSSFATQPICRTIATPEPQMAATLTVQGGPVTLSSWATFRSTGGIALSNVGIVGAQFQHFGRADAALVAEELRSYRPDLIIVAFGTNEGFAPRLDAATYEAALRAQVARMQRLAPGVPMLLLGAPDAATRNEALSANASGPRIDCRLPARSLADIIAGLKAEDAPGEGAQTPIAPEVDPLRRALFVPPAMAVVREVQRRVAADLGLAFWDWHAAMGGDCTAARWVRANPPLMRGDFVHYTKAGGAEIARLLDDDLAKAAAVR